MNESLSKLIDHIYEKGGLGPPDLSILIGKPKSTIYAWWQYGRLPDIVILKETKRRLRIIRDYVDKNGIVVPYEVRQRARKQYITGIKNVIFGVSENGPSK